MSINTAKRCFEESKQLFGSPQTEPEKFNLYNGLYNLAEEVERIRNKVDMVGSAIDQLGVLLQKRGA